MFIKVIKQLKYADAPLNKKGKMYQRQNHRFFEIPSYYSSQLLVQIVFNKSWT